MAGGSRARPALRGFSRGGRAAQARRAGKKDRNKKSVKSCESCLVKKHGFFRRPGGIASDSTGQSGGLNFFPSFWEGRKTKDKSSQSCRSCRTRRTQGPCFNTPNAQNFMTPCIEDMKSCRFLSVLVFHHSLRGVGSTSRRPILHHSNTPSSY